MPILHTITKTESGYALRVWEPAETTKDRVRPCLWEINLNAGTIDEFGVVLEQINRLHQYQSQKLEVVPSRMPLPSQDLTKIDFGKSKSETRGNGEPISYSSDTQRFISHTSTEIPTTAVLVRERSPSWYLIIFCWEVSSLESWKVGKASKLPVWQIVPNLQTFQRNNENTACQGDLGQSFVTTSKLVGCRKNLS